MDGRPGSAVRWAPKHGRAAGIRGEAGTQGWMGGRDPAVRRAPKDGRAAGIRGEVATSGW